MPTVCSDIFETNGSWGDDGRKRLGLRGIYGVEVWVERAAVSLGVEEVKFVFDGKPNVMKRKSFLYIFAKASR